FIMKSFLFTAVFAVLYFCVPAQTENKIVIGKVDSVYSNILGEQRKVWVYVPNGFMGTNDSSTRFPVVYLLDGDSHFQSVVGVIQQLSEANGNNVCPQMIIVGIPNTDRTRDLTPTHISSDQPMMDSNFSKNTGGGENFVAFMEKELMPHIDSLYPTAPYKILIGHSFGGLTVMNIITKHTKLFNAYIAIDPSMWYDREKFLKATKQKLSQQKYAGIKLYLGIANTMPEGMTIEKMLKDTTSDTRHIRSIFAMDKFIKAGKQNSLQFASKYYADDDHGSVPLISEYDGLRFIFNYYKLKFAPRDFTDSSTAFVTKYKTHYETVSKELGYKVSPPEVLTNGLAYESLNKKFFTKAAAFYKLNMENYPNSSNACVAYADLLTSTKDTANAIVYYQKANAINKSDETLQKLNALQGKEVFKLTNEQLQKYAGIYLFESVSITSTVTFKDAALWISADGQGSYELVPLEPDTFGIKNVNGFKLHFEMNGDKPTGLTSTQPNGTFIGKLKQ
ncbi:MAG TPA: alpha/beta hydrolase-fold protein, partial [Panacibacter sp.]|nr:alpha/beta hydrolase-fold protein [Panacibacter sp.]